MTQLRKDNINYLNLKDLKADEILLIPADKLLKHPERSDEDIKHLTALIENIKQNGVLENLIVVPCTGYHYGKLYVIGSYREFLAAQAAGVEELPCRVVHMDASEQREIMNIYR